MNGMRTRPTPVSSRRNRAALMLAVLGCAWLMVSAGEAWADPAAARRNYSLCKELLANDDPCAALKACEDGIKALSSAAFVELRDAARTACSDKQEEQRKRRRLKLECEQPGQIRTLENEAECCWPGQSWQGRCQGTPTQCPEGFVAQDEACVLVPCEAGKEHVSGFHCCWPEQVWADSQRRCVGIPACPAGQEARGETCFPIVPDTDKDGIPDADDLCPELSEDYDGFEDHDGCPDVDNDGDGICDPEVARWDRTLYLGSCRGADTCPLDPEDYDGFEDNDGCPDLDNDDDGIPDELDLCPLQAGLVDFEGCPPPVDHSMAYLSWSAVGGGFLLLGVGLGMHLWAESLRDEAYDASSEQALQTSLTERDVKDLESSANTLDTVGLVSAVVGGAAVLTGAVLLALSLDTEQPDEGSLSLSASPSFLGFSFEMPF